MKKEKRLVALMMSLLLTMVWCCPAISNATQQSTETARQNVLYEDDFTTDEKYIAALGDTSWQSFARPIWKEDKLVSGDYESWKEAKFALLNGLGAENWMNYTVEAEITTSTITNRACYVATYGKTTGNTVNGDAYQFNYQGDDKFILRRSASGNAAKDLVTVSVSSIFDTFIRGQMIHMSITAVTYEDYVHLICKATYGGETKEIFNYKDTDEGRYTCGMPGFGLQQQNSSLDNLKVVKTEVVLYEDDFTTDTKYIEALGSTGWSTYKQPIWENDKLVSGTYTSSADAKFALLNGLGGAGWKNYTVEADITAGTANDRVCYVAVYGRTTGNRVNGDAYQFGVLGQSGLFILNRTATGDSRNVAEIKKLACSHFFENYTKGDTIRMSITAVTDDTGVTIICKATYAGKTEVIFNYRDTSDGRYTCGMPGFGLQQQESSLDNVKVFRGTLGINEDPFYENMPIVEVNEIYEAPDTGLETTYYNDDFQDEATGTNPSHWLEEPTEDAWKIYDKSGKVVYGTESKGLAYTWLHTFESDPVLSMDFMVDEVGAKGRLEFLTRYTQADEHGKVAVGYDASMSKWYIYSCQGEDFLPRKVYSTSTYKLAAGEWYNVKIQENENTVWVYVNDELVIADGGIEMAGYGRIGVLSEHISLYIDNLTYSMPHSGAVNDGIMEELWDDAVYQNFNTMEIESLGGDTLIGYRANARYISYDKGLTWTLNLTDSYTELKTGENGAGLYSSAIQLNDGVFLMAYSDTYKVMRSDDNMETWREVGQVSEELAELNSASQGAIKAARSAVIHSNSLKKFTLKDGTVRIFLPVGITVDTQSATSKGMYTRIFYSDDYGVTWKESTNDTRDVSPGYVVSSSTDVYSWCEAKMWQRADGTICLSNTRDYYGLTYTESENGETWEGLKSLPYIQNAVSSHDVMEDPENPGTYYMIYLNDKCETDGSTNPRERLSLAKSTDGEKWEHVMDIERFTNYEFDDYWLKDTGRGVFQILDPAINIIDGYMYINFGRSYKQLVNSDHNYQQMRLVRIDMDKLPETKGWDASNVADPTRAAKLEIETEAQTIFKQNDTFSMGGTIKETDFNGDVKITPMESFSLASGTPDMSKIGVQTITLMNKYGTSVSYEIEVTYETEYHCLDGQSYSVPNPGIFGTVTVDGVKRESGYTISQAGQYIVVTDKFLSDSETTMVVLYYTGDATGDKMKDEQVDVKDLVRLKRGMKDDTLFTKAGKEAADMNGDGNIDDADAALLRNMIVQ